MKKPFILIVTLLGLFLLASLIVFAYIEIKNKPSYNKNITVCTQEALLCPDGTYVSRTGPNCEFTPCPSTTTQTTTKLTETEAKVIAQKSCIKGGEALGIGTYNDGTKTWWFDANLNAIKEGCNPACVVSEETKTAEINWRCTGLKQPY